MDREPGRGLVSSGETPRFPPRAALSWSLSPMPERVLVLSIPQLRHRDVTPGALASLDDVERRGGLAEFLPAFPCLAASSFATIVTGTAPAEHGIIGDAWFDRALGRVVTRPFSDSFVVGAKLWERLREVRPDARSLAWFTPNLRDAAIDLAAWIDPDSGLTTLPADLAGSLTGRFGPYPAPRIDPKGEPLGLEATAWILRTAAVVIAEEKPDLALVRIPYLGQMARRYGPDGREASRSVGELEKILAPFLKSVGPTMEVVAVTESVATPVLDPLYPNLVLRGLGYLQLVPHPDGGLDVDLDASAAFAVADHQLCHIYVNDPGVTATVASTFSAAADFGVNLVACGSRRRRLGLDHPRAGDVILVSSPERWFAPDWWQRPSERPARPEAGSGLAIGAELNPAHIGGSLGAPPPNAEYHGIVVSSRAELVHEGELLEAPELSRRLAAWLGIV
jgi:predicted AlkP superfamily pyrophosphatase or phosphodiesterase